MLSRLRLFIKMKKILVLAAAIVAGGKAETMEEGFGLAKESIDSGRALEKLKEFVKCTSKKR